MFLVQKNSHFTNYLPLITTILFCIFASYVAFELHTFFSEDDGVYYFKMGEFFFQDSKNSFMPDAPMGGPIFYAWLNNFFNDGFFVMKLFAVIGSTVMVFVSFYIIRNVFDEKIALLSQVLIAVNPRIFYLSYSALNEIFALSLIFSSLYFLTKKQSKNYDLIIGGLLLGIASMIRYQGILVFLAVALFLLIRNKELKDNFSKLVLFSTFFIIALSPFLIFNYITYDDILPTTENFHVIWQWKYQPPEWRAEAENIMINGNDESIMFVDFGLFLKNYSYNFLFNSFDKLFYFVSSLNISILPGIPFLAIIPFVGGYLYSINFQLTRNSIFYIILTSIVTIGLILSLGDFEDHFFALIFAPLLVISIMNFNKIRSNHLLLLIIALVFISIISISTPSRGNNYFGMWLIVPSASAIFFVYVLPRLFEKIKIKKSKNVLSLLIIISIIILNILASVVVTSVYIFPHEFLGVQNELSNIISQESQFEKAGYELKKIADILNEQENIKDSYIMSNDLVTTYYTNAKYISTSYTEGKKGGTIEDFISRNNWSDYDLFISKTMSVPPQKDEFTPIPDYLIYRDVLTETDIDPRKINYTQYFDLKILNDPNHAKIPSNFELLYQSNSSKTTVYKIIKD